MYVRQHRTEQCFHFIHHVQCTHNLFFAFVSLMILCSGATTRQDGKIMVKVNQSFNFGILIRLFVAANSFGPMTISTRHIDTIARCTYTLSNCAMFHLKYSWPLNYSQTQIDAHKRHVPETIRQVCVDEQQQHALINTYEQSVTSKIFVS